MPLLGRWIDGQSTRYRDRHDAGRRLAEHLEKYAHRSDVIVLALPRGGVPVGYEVAMALAAPLDLCLVRKLGVPGHSELAMGAIASGGARVLNQDLIRSLLISADEVERVAASEQVELARQDLAFRGVRPPPELAGRIVILVDDGLATGSTMRVAVQSMRAFDPGSVVVAVPVAPVAIYDEFLTLADEVVSVLTPNRFGAVGLWYEDFTPTSDDGVRALLARIWGQHDAEP